jgi:hypothetical protein
MLIEVMIAITIMSISIAALFNLQANVLDGVWRENSRVERIFKLRNLFFDPQYQTLIAPEYQKAREFEEQNTRFFTNLKYEVRPVDSKSDLFRRFPNIYLVQASGSWSGINLSYEEQLVGFVHILPAEEQA